MSDLLASSLLCDETDDALFDDSGGGDPVEHDENPMSGNGFESEDSLMVPVMFDEGFDLMVEKEKGFLPREDYVSRLRSGEVRLNLRQDGFDWILKACFHFGYGASTFCLAMNYFDRYLSNLDLPEDQSWHVQLVAVACFSIAAKVDEIYVPSLVAMQVGEPRFIFEPKTVQRMELLVLSTLNWRMCALTPCSFIEYILMKIMGEDALSPTIISRSCQLIFRMIQGIDFLNLTPSQIALAVGITLSGKMNAGEIDAAISSFVHIDKDNVLKCIQLINDLWLISKGDHHGGNGPAQPVPTSPSGVLDTVSFSYRSEDSTNGSAGKPSDDCHDTKRRRTDVVPS
ncbi:hypothetical protein Drorol1_Dr00021914 [Drosera rotundifolia]